LREQAQRWRAILAKITELPTGEPFDRTPLSALIEEAVGAAPQFRHLDRSDLSANRAAEPAGARNPAIRYGLGNLIENAVDFATPGSRFSRAGRWTRSPSPSATTGRVLPPKSLTGSARPM